MHSIVSNDDFAVVTIATGRNDEMGMKEFLDSVNVTNLPLHRDPTSALARDMGVLGLPITVILDPQGNEIARLQGDAHWDSESAKAIVAALIAAAKEEQVKQSLRTSTQKAHDAGVFGVPSFLINGQVVFGQDLSSKF